jgi:ABC-2 type transport system ATP-binding protein
VEADDIALSVRDLSKSYGDFLAVDHISFDVRRGEVFGLLGPNGAGKTTTIRMLCGLLKADSGRMELGGLSMGEGYARLKARIGLCPQDIVVWELLTCMEQLVFMGSSYGMPTRAAKERSAQVLRTLGLWDKRGKLAKTLSGGMQRRLNMALALVHDPELVILDEPQAGLDPQSRVLVRDLIRDIARERTVILTTHDMDEADRLSDRVAIIDHGKLLIIDTPSGIKSMSGSGEVLSLRVSGLDTGSAGELPGPLAQAFPEAIFADGLIHISAPDPLSLIPDLDGFLKGRGLGVEDMTVRKRSLEDAFIELTGRGLRE